MTGAPTVSILSQREEGGDLGVLSLLTDPQILVCYYDLGGQTGIAARCDSLHISHSRCYQVMQIVAVNWFALR